MGNHDDAKAMIDIIDQRIEKKFAELLKLGLRLEDYATIAVVSPLTVYVNDSTTAVPCGNPRGLTLTAGQKVWVAYPNGNLSLKHVDRVI